MNPPKQQKFCLLSKIRSVRSLIGDNKIQIVKKSIFNLFARTRTRTIQEFLHFCCHKCHTISHNPLTVSQLCLFLRFVLTIGFFNPQILDDKTEKNTLFAPSFMRNTLLSSLIFHLECDTCDSKKNNIAVGRRALRVRARAFCPLLSPRFRFLLGDSATFPIFVKL